MKFVILGGIFLDFDFSKKANMDSILNRCSNLEKNNFGNINTSLVEIMNQLFQNFASLTSINLSNFDTSSVQVELNV